MAKFVGRPTSRSYGQTDSSGLSHVERKSISNYISHSRDNGQSGQGHKVTLDSEVQSLMRAGVSESTARQLIGNLKGERDNPGVSTLALALPNPGGVGVRPPNLDEIRRNGMEDKMAKRKLSQAQKEALARGREALQAMRDNISKSNFKKLQAKGEAVTLDVPGYYRGVKKKEGLLPYTEVLARKTAKAGSKVMERTIPVGNYVDLLDADGKPVMGAGGKVKKIRQGNAVDADGKPVLKTIRTAYAKKLDAIANPEKYVVVYKRRESLQPLTEDGERGQGVKKEKSAADNAHISKLIKELKAQINEFKKPKQASDLKGLTEKETKDYIARNQKKLQKIADGTLKTFNRMTERLARLEESLKAAEGTPIPRAHTADYVKPSRTPLTEEQKAATKAKQEARKALRKEVTTLIQISEDLGKPVTSITLDDLLTVRKSPEYQSREIQAQIDALIEQKRALASRDNGYDRDNITLKSGLYGVASFVGGSLAGVVVTNGVHNLASRAGLKSTTADYITKGVGALLAVDLFMSMRDNRGYLFHRIEDRGVRIGLAAGLILPMIARGFVGDMLSKYEFGRKINTFLLPDASAAVAKAAAAAASATPASGFGSIYDLAFDEVELPTSGVGVDVNEAVAGMGRYVTGAEGVGRYVTGAEGVGRYVTGTSGLGVNVSEAFAGVGVNATEALAGQQPSFRTGGTVFRDGLRGLGADEAFDILSELENFDDLSDDDQYMEGVGAVSRGEKAVYASAADAQKIKSALATAGREVALTFLRPSNVRPNTYIVIVSRPGAESAKKALSQMTQVPSSQPIPPTTLPNAIMTRGVFGKPMFPVTT